MTGQIISLVEALTPRACRTAELLAGRLPDAGLWAGYRAEEGLIAELRYAGHLDFRRRGAPKAVLVFRNAQMVGMRQVEWGEPVVLEANVGQRFSSHILLDQPVRYSKTLSHTFGSVRTLAEQVKAGLEATLKVGGEAGTQGGIHGVTAKVYAELAVKLYGEYQRQWGGSESKSDTVSDQFERTVSPPELEDGPVRIDYVANRSLNREESTVRADCDYEHTVELIDETGAGERPPKIQLVCDSWGAFRQVVQGFAPRNYHVEIDGRQERRPTAFYDEFIHDPIRGEALQALSAPARGAIEFMVQYDNVIAQDIKVL